jgi:TonB-linked SusC/RagA family outer membrane protein
MEKEVIQLVGSEREAIRKIKGQSNHLILLFLILIFSAGLKSHYVFGSEINPFSTVQQFKVNGIVIDYVTSEPLPGVSIVVEGTTTGTVTNVDGKYSLVLPSMNETLVFTYVGYVRQVVPVDGRNIIDIGLRSSIEELDEIVVIAYGTTPRSNLTGSVTAISADEIKDVASPRLSTLIQGKSAGVYARTSSGRPGASSGLNLRGRGSISTTNSPLWVIDGVVIGHSEPDINPADVQSITILKDASATALYGSRAANGVILVETIKPTEGVSRLSFNANTGVTQLDRGRFSIMNSQELYDYHTNFNTTDWFSSDFLNTDTDWWNIATQLGTAQEYNISYMSGVENLKTYISGTYYGEDGAVRGYGWDRYSAMANMELGATERLTIKANVTGNYTDIDNREHSTYNAHHYVPWDHPYREDGSIVEPRTHTDYRWIGRDQHNYLYNLQWNWSKSRAFNLRSNIDFTYKITDWLTFSSMNNIGMNFTRDETLDDPRSTTGISDNGRFQGGHGDSRNRFTNQMLRFANEFGDHSIQSFLAYEYGDYYGDATNAIGIGIAPGLQVLSATSSPRSVTGSTSESARQAVLFNLQYVYDGRYLGTLSFNREGTSSFGRGSQYGNFWSLSGGWNVHREEFINNIDWINILRLRLSYGQVGNSPSGMPHLGLYSVTGQYGGYPSATPSQAANRLLSWETSTTANFAIDTRIYNRISASIDVYERNNSGLLYNVPLSSVSGYTSVWENIGAIRNRGVELVVKPDVIRGGSFRWDANFNIAFNKNEVQELYENQPITSGHKRIDIGHDMDEFFMRKRAGVDPENGHPLWERVVENPEGTTTIELVNNWNQATLEWTGKTSEPDFVGGWINTFTYNNFSLMANIYFVQGVYLYNSSRETFDSDGAYPTFNHMNLSNGWSRWEKPVDIATHPQPVFGGNRLSNRASTRYLENASYVKLRNLTLSYRIPNNFANQIGISRARVYLSADNILTLTKWSGMDPESAGLYPVARKMLFGINLDF